jgi:hypothetical protein
VPEAAAVEVLDCEEGVVQGIEDGFGLQGWQVEDF